MKGFPSSRRDGARLYRGRTQPGFLPPRHEDSGRPRSGARRNRSPALPPPSRPWEEINPGSISGVCTCERGCSQAGPTRASRQLLTKHFFSNTYFSQIKKQNTNKQKTTFQDDRYPAQGHIDARSLSRREGRRPAKRRGQARHIPSVSQPPNYFPDEKGH